jgi:hypothetical protein
MGQEILYCYKCQTRLMGSEFEKGKAFKVGGQAACAVCVKDLVASLPPVGSESERGRRIVSTTRIPIPGPDSSSKHKTITNRVALPTAPPEKPKTALFIGIGVVVLTLILAALAMNSGSNTHRVDPTPTPPVPAPPTGRTPDPVSPPPAGTAAELRDLDEKLRAGLAGEDYRGSAALLDEARKRHNTLEWLSDIDLRLPQVVGRARRNSLALRDQGIDAQKRNDAAAIKSLKEKIAAWGFPVLVEEFDKALAEAAAAPPPPPPVVPPPPPPVTPPDPNAPPFVVYKDALGPGVRNHSWSSTVNFSETAKVHEGSKSISWFGSRQSAGFYVHFDKPLELSQYPYCAFSLYVNHDSPQLGMTLWGTSKDGSQVIDIGKLGGPIKVGEWKRYVVPTEPFHPAGNVINSFVLMAGKITTDPLYYLDNIVFLRTAEEKSATAPVAPVSGKWMQAAMKASARDYDGAIKDLEDPADVELFKLAAQVPVEAAKIVDKWAKGQKVRVEYLGPAGDRVAVEGAVLTADAVKLTLARDDGPFDVPLSEFSPGTLADLFRTRADRKPNDARAAAAFCALEGDVDGVKRSAGENAAIPEKYLAFAQKRGMPSEAESAARRQFWSAEADFTSPRRRPAAIEKYSNLLAGSDAARLRPFLTARLEAAKDTVFLAEDLSGRGTFTLTGGPKIDIYWGSTADSAVGKAKENYVEAEFYALPGATYRAWVWAGACCQETFDASWQATELTAPNPKSSKEPYSCEPGSDMAPSLKMPASLRKWHAQHGGPKEPARWEWLPLALPKYETPGPKKIRILTSQQGYSVAAIAVSATRHEAPRDVEMKELEKTRTGSRKAGGNEPPGSILHEFWLGIDGSAIADLLKAPSFQGKPSGSSLRDLFEGPRDMADRYGARMRGFVHAPVTGNYTFWIATDDDGELFLSTDEFPMKKRSIATSPTAGFRDWTRAPSCKSAPIPLVAGKRYYIEALQKEGIGNDHLSVGWTLPDGGDERPIPGKRLSPWVNVATAPSAAPTGLVFVKAYNINGLPTTIDGRKWDGRGAPELATSADGFENQSVPLNPPTDDARAAMIRSSAFGRGGTVVKVSGLAPGNYQAYLYFWEDNASATFDIVVQGKEVMKGYVSGAAGHWERLGPWAAPVTDGILEIHSVGNGDANFSGLEIWKPAGK